MRLLAAALVAGAALAAGLAAAGGTAPAAPVAKLTITVWPQGKEAATFRRWTLRCRPLGGTHPARARACARLLSLNAPFRPVPKDAMCTQIYGGPAEALVTGTFRGRRVQARFSRTDGCQIARWNRVGALLPVGGSA